MLMPTEVSSLARILSGFKEEEGKGKGKGESETKPAPAPASRELQDLNKPPATDGAAPPVEDSAALDLNLVAPATSEYHSVCTIEKVRSALERVERESRGKPHQRRMDVSPSSSSSSALTTSSIKRRWGEEEVDGSDSSDGSLMVARCPRCLFYVLVANKDPRCPFCRSHVPVSSIYRKKPRILF